LGLKFIVQYHLMHQSGVPRKARQSNYQLISKKLYIEGTLKAGNS